MTRKRLSGAIAAAAIAAAASGASAQLIVAVDDPGEPIWSINPATNAASSFLAGFGAGALATDETNRVLYFMPNTVTLWKWAYGVPASAPELLGTVRNASGSNISITGLAFNSDSGELFGSRTLSSSAGPEGFYKIDLATAVATNIISTPSSDYDFGGFDYDNATDTFYAISDPSTSGAGQSGLFRIDLSAGTLSLVSAYPLQTSDSPPDIDGLAVGNGRAYLVEDRAVQTGGKIYAYNLTTNAYEPALQTPWFFNEIFAGATWSPTLAEALATVPEPHAGALLAAGLLALRRRR